MQGKLIIFSAPSGSGKSTIISHLMNNCPELCLTFSVSATSRPPRGAERDGVEYYFLTPDEFRRRIEAGAFIEYEEVYRDRFYGTLRSEVDGRLAKGENVVLDLDVKGGCRVKEMYGAQALSLFIQPPSIAELRRRLEARGTESADAINDRIARAEYELSFASRYDIVVVNDNLAAAQSVASRAIRDFIMPISPQ